MRSQFTETIKVENRYNRLFLFDGMTYHGVNTFDTDTERLTLVFFLNHFSSLFNHSVDNESCNHHGSTFWRTRKGSKLFHEYFLQFYNDFPTLGRRYQNRS